MCLEQVKLLCCCLVLWVVFLPHFLDRCVSNNLGNKDTKLVKNGCVVVEKFMPFKGNNFSLAWSVIWWKFEHIELIMFFSSRLFYFGFSASHKFYNGPDQIPTMRVAVNNGTHCLNGTQKSKTWACISSSVLCCKEKAAPAQTVSGWN